MARLPTVGGDINNWGTLLNEFLLIEHTAGGLHSNIPAAGANTQVQFNDSGVFGANSGFVYNKTSHLVTITGVGLGAGVEEKVLTISTPTNTSLTINTELGTEASGAVVFSNPTNLDTQYSWIFEALPISLAPAGHGANKIFNIADANARHWRLLRPSGGGVATRVEFGDWTPQPGPGKMCIINDLDATYDVVRLKGFAAQSGAMLSLVDSADANLFSVDATGIVTTTKYIAGAEMTAPVAPAANGYRLFAEDNGAGKTRLMVQFATGAAQQVAIEP